MHQSDNPPLSSHCHYTMGHMCYNSINVYEVTPGLTLV